MDKPYLRVADIATLLDVRPELVRAWLRSGKLRGVRLADRTGYRVKRSDFEAFLKARESGEAAA